jgi:hypothetical protein
MRTLLSASLACALLATGCFGGAAVLQDPQPAYVPPGIPAENVRAAILSVLDGRHWHAESEQQNQIVAVLVVRNHSARVLITYNQQGVYIQYMDSQALDYYVDSAGRPRIHRNYNRWVERLAQNIEQAIQGGPGQPVIVFTP